MLGFHLAAASVHHLQHALLVRDPQPGWLVEKAARIDNPTDWSVTHPLRKGSSEEACVSRYGARVTHFRAHLDTSGPRLTSSWQIARASAAQ